MTQVKRITQAVKVNNVKAKFIRNKGNISV